MHLLLFFITGTCQTFHTDRNCGTSRGQDVIPWDLLAEIDFFVLSYSLTLS